MASPRRSVRPPRMVVCAACRDVAIASGRGVGVTASLFPRPAEASRLAPASSGRVAVARLEMLFCRGVCWVLFLALGVRRAEAARRGCARGLLSLGGALLAFRCGRLIPPRSAARLAAAQLPCFRFFFVSRSLFFMVVLLRALWGRRARGVALVVLLWARAAMPRAGRRARPRRRRRPQAPAAADEGWFGLFVYWEKKLHIRKKLYICFNKYLN